MRIMTVFDSERMYTESFAGMLSREKSFPYEVHAFTDRSKLEEFLRTRHAALSLVAEKDFTSEMASWSSDRFVILREDRRSPECERFPGIRKYQPFPAVLSELLLYADESALALMKEQRARQTQIIAVGSPVRRCGSTLFSLALARLLAEKKESMAGNTTIDDFRSEFDSQTAALIAHFKFSISHEHISASVYANLVNIACKQQRRQAEKAGK